LGALSAEILVRVHLSDTIDQDNFTMKGSEAMGFDLSIRELIDICLAENDRRFALYDDRLVRPQLLARPARIARALLSRPSHLAKTS